MNESLKDYFYFSRSEKIGILVLLIIIVLLIFFPYFYDSIFFEQQPLNKSFETEIRQFAQSIEQIEEPEYKNRLDQYIIERYDSIDLFFFNPNSTSDEKFQKLGFTEKQIKTINNYRQKGGKFYTKDDFRKIYGIRHQQYQIVKPYILLPDENNYGSNPDSKIVEKKENDQSVADLFVFDPNTASDADFIKLGLTDANIKTIHNYQNKIGKFKSKEDFKKIYGITEAKYNQLEPYIFIKQKNEIIPTKVRVELNSANLEDLINVNGIGKYTAESIINYREKLGGFADIGQMTEIKGMSPEIFEFIKTNIYVDKSLVKEIRLNFAETGEFAAHPYLNYQQAKEIVKFRSINGPYQDKKQLLQNKILLEQTYKKIEPYLTLN